MANAVYEGSLGTLLDVTGQSTSFDSIAFTMPVVANGLMIISLAWPSNPGTVTITWDALGTPQPATLIPNCLGNNTTYAAKYAVLAPHSGNLTLRVATSNLIETMVHCTGYSNVLQTSVALACPNGASNTGTSTAPTITVTSAAGDLTEDLVVPAPPGGVPASPTQTTITIVSGGGALDYGSSRETSSSGAASVTHAWTISSAAWISVAASIKSANAGAVSDGMSVGGGRAMRPAAFKPGGAR